MKRLVIIVTIGLLAAGVGLPSAAVEADRDVPPGVTGSALVEVAAVSRTTVSGWSRSRAVAASTAPLRVPVQVRTGGRLVQRTLSVERRAVGKKRWKSLRTATTDRVGRYVAVLTAPAGRWQFRLRINAAAGARAARTKVRRVVVTRLMAVAGSAHTCALRPGGTVRCWGANGYGQLGDGTRKDRLLAVLVKGITGATAIAAGAYHTCAVVAKGRVKCWGRNAYRQLGVGGVRTRVRPVTVKEVRGAKVITASGNHTCVAVKRGRVTCWGTWGYIDEAEPDFESSAPKRVPRLKGVTALAASRDFDCALEPPGRVRCWGSAWGANDWGQLGDGTASWAPSSRAKPVRVKGLASASAIATGMTHACALVTGGRVACWGLNLYQGLGRRAKEWVIDGGTPALSPVLVKGLTGQVALTASANHTCSLARGGSVRCLGSNEMGQLGDGLAYLSSTVPVVARGVRGAVGITAASDLRDWSGGPGASAPSGERTCAQLAQGGVSCWGANDQGQLGDGKRSAAKSATPRRVTGLAAATDLSAGSASTCAVEAGDRVKCWGSLLRARVALQHDPTTVLRSQRRVRGGARRRPCLRTLTRWRGHLLGRCSSRQAIPDPRRHQRDRDQRRVGGIERRLFGVPLRCAVGSHRLVLERQCAPAATSGARDPRGDRPRAEPDRRLGRVGLRGCHRWGGFVLDRSDAARYPRRWDHGGLRGQQDCHPALRAAG